MLVCWFKGSGFRGSGVKKQQKRRDVLSFKKGELPDIRTHEPETLYLETLNPEPLNPEPGTFEPWTFDETVKSQFFRLLSFRRTPESSDFNMFWMPDQVRHDDSRTFYETVNLWTLNPEPLNPIFYV